MLTLETSAQIEFTLLCKNCGAELDGTINTDRRGNTEIIVETCSSCISEKESQIKDITEEKDNEIEELQKQIESLQDEIEILKNKEIFMEIVDNGKTIKL